MSGAPFHRISFKLAWRQLKAVRNAWSVPALGPIWLQMLAALQRPSVVSSPKFPRRHPLSDRASPYSSSLRIRSLSEIPRSELLDNCRVHPVDVVVAAEKEEVPVG